MKSPPPKNLSVEQLEDRCTPAFGVPWFDATSLTLSFVPDGANVSGKGSNLFAQLNSFTAQQTWQREVLRAYQTWAVQANVNIGLAADGGQAMGTPGSPQEDIRFGDIRIGGRMLSAVAVNDNMAGGVPFDYAAATWAGDVVFNTRYNFGIGDNPATGQRDLFSVILHEAGHSLGVGPNLVDPTSATYSSYSVKTGLSATDVLALRAMYGARSADAYEGLLGNGTTATAYNLTANGNKIAVNGDITAAGDVDYFTFTTPAAGPTGLTVKLKAAGLSLLTGRLTVLDAAGNTVGSVVTTDPLNNNLSITLPTYAANTTYRVKVEGAGADVFSVGSYVLKLDYTNGTFGANADVTNRYYTNFELAANETQATAATLSPVRTGKANTFSLVGVVGSGTDADWYKITPTAPAGYTGTLYVGVLSPVNGLKSTVSVYNAAGALLPAEVVMNENGVYQVQLPDQATGTTYFVRVASANGNGSGSAGGYNLLATLTPAAAVSFRGLTSAALTQSSAQVYTTMAVDGNRLSQFTFSATTPTANANVAVRVSIYDADGKVIFSKSVKANEKVRTGEIWLPQGTFTVVFNAATNNSSTLPTVTYNFSIRELSDPIDPLPEDPTLPKPVDQPIILPPPTPTPPPAPIVDPVQNPFLGLP